jgi:poly(A) polymerase
VGGCLRDALLGVPVKDVDIVVDGAVEPFSRTLADRLGGAVFASSDAFGTWRIVVGDVRVDVAALREKTAAVTAAVTPTAATRPGRLVADLRARDFTVDALARSLEGGELVDPLRGLDDLAARRLRLCSATALVDDPLRVVRLARLARAFDLVPDAVATEAACRAAPGLSSVSGERLRDELSAVLLADGSAAAFRDLAVWGALTAVLPELDQLRGVEQNPYHHLDVFDHTLEALTYVAGVVEQIGSVKYLASPAESGMPGVAPLVPVSWAVLLHDIGKPAARKVDDEGRVLFWHHDEIGREMAVGIAARLKMSKRFSMYLGTLIRWHLRLGFLVREQPLTRRALVRYRRDVAPWVFESVVLSLCDRLATRGDRTSLTSIARHYRLARSVWSGVSKAPVPHVLSGHDVMELLGVEPGAAVGQALDALEEEVEAGEIATPDEARAFLRDWWGERKDGDPLGAGGDAGGEEGAGGADRGLRHG